MIQFLNSNDLVYMGYKKNTMENYESQNIILLNEMKETMEVQMRRIYQKFLNLIFKLS